MCRPKPPYVHKIPPKNRLHPTSFSSFGYACSIDFNLNCLSSLHLLFFLPFLYLRFSLIFFLLIRFIASFPLSCLFSFSSLLVSLLIIFFFILGSSSDYKRWYGSSLFVWLHTTRADRPTNSVPPFLSLQRYIVCYLLLWLLYYMYLPIQSSFPLPTKVYIFIIYNYQFSPSFPPKHLQYCEK